MKDKRTTGGGIGFFGALAILFIGLKLGHVIDWPWWVVLLPIWVPYGILAICLLILGIVKYTEEKGRNAQK